MKRPVWILSMDTEQFCAPPMTTGGLKAHFLSFGRTANDTDVHLVHFFSSERVGPWLANEFREQVVPRAETARRQGHQPVFGLSCYTWNMAEFLEIARIVKNAISDALVIAGGPHVQRAEDFLYDEAIDVVVLGEGEETFTELLDCRSKKEWASVRGCAYGSTTGAMHRTPPRARTTVLDQFPSALEVLPLRDDHGEPLYQQAAYETSRGCPYRCAFCEWGTGAIGTKMFQLSLDRVRSDLEMLVAGGIKDIWLCDSNFGALKEDLAKTEMIIEIKEKTGLPKTFATSWSKNHNKRVQQIVRLLHRNGLLSHYHLALQTLTPKALELSHRTNMRANDYEPVVRSLAAEGVPVAAELIWGLPGDSLGSFETNLDQLLTVFPNINIFGYTLLPGTEFFDRREEYSLETLPVAGYGKAKGEYVVGCHTFSRHEGEEGYFLITAYIVLARGQLIPRTVQFLAMGGVVPVSPMLREILRALIAEFHDDLPPNVENERMVAYERRSDLYLIFLSQPERAYGIIRRVLESWLERHGASDRAHHVMKVFSLDQALCPRTGDSRTTHHVFDFEASSVERALQRMEQPAPHLLDEKRRFAVDIHHPGGVGDVLLDPDGGVWVRGKMVDRVAA